MSGNGPKAVRQGLEGVGDIADVRQRTTPKAGVDQMQTILEVMLNDRFLENQSFGWVEADGRQCAHCCRTCHQMGAFPAP